MGLHARYQRILSTAHHALTLDKETEDAARRKLSKAFKGLMSALFSEKGAMLNINILTSDKAQNFIETHASILDSSFKKVKMSDGMRRRLERSNYIFSGMKTFHELNEAFPSLIDDNGDRKPFERFLNDVQKIDKTYNIHYLRAEYNFVQASAEMAAKWERFTEDGDRYNLQYRTAGDDKVRPSHAALNGVTLPMSDSFWESYYPPNGWGCRCTVVQVRKSKYATTPHDDAMARGGDALSSDKKGIFRFNAGKEKKAMPDYNPYTIRRCNDCDLAKGKAKLAFIPDNELCAACRIVRECYGNGTRTQNARERTHFLHEMEPLLSIKKEKSIGTETIKVGFTTYGNKHLYSDTFGRSRILEKEDLASLDRVLQNATFIESSPLTHPRTDGIDRFYYFEGEIRGQRIRLNVARKVVRRSNGFVRIAHFLYSINDI